MSVGGSRVSTFVRSARVVATGVFTEMAFVPGSATGRCSSASTELRLSVRALTLAPFDEPTARNRYRPGVGMLTVAAKNPGPAMGDLSPYFRYPVNVCQVAVNGPAA